jgi:Iap family predicted aminopeptidase
MNRRLLWLALLIVLCITLLAPAVAVARPWKPSYDQAVDQLFARGYPQAVENRLIAFGAAQNYLGLRSAGDPADNAGAAYIASQLRAMGLRNVRLEPVPIDAWVFHSASVAVGARTMRCSALNAGGATPKAGITAPVVYVHGGSAADFDAAGNVRGKIVLLDQMFSSWWQMWPWAEATGRGAAGIIYTFNPDDPVYWGEPDALGVFSNEADSRFIPLVNMARQDGEWLRAKLVAGEPVTATMKCDVSMKSWERGGVGYNVVGEIPGTDDSRQMVLMTAHHDTAGPGALDDTGPCVNLLTMANAMQMSGYRPQRTVEFLFTTGEEYGWDNSYYDWLVGAWWAAGHAHRDWAGRVAGQINLEIMAQSDATFQMRTSPELVAWADAAGADNAALLPNSYEVATPVSSWNDQWPFTAAGVPAITVEASTPYYESHWYHTQYDNVSAMDWGYLAKINKVVFRMQRQLNTGLLPYDLKGRADDLAATVDADELIAAGADPTLAARLSDDVAAFVAASQAFETRKGSIRASTYSRVNKTLLGVEKAIDGNFTALDAWDLTIYPHQQVLWNIEYIDAAIAALDQEPADTAAALDAVTSVDRNWIAVNFGRFAVDYNLGLFDPSSARLCFGELAHLSPVIDLTQQYHQIEAGQVTGPLATLKAARSSQVPELNERLTKMTQVLETVTPDIKRLH